MFDRWYKNICTINAFQLNFLLIKYFGRSFLCVVLECILHVPNQLLNILCFF